MTMMFEVEDLLVASPATVSRCGMVYMEPESLGLGVLVKSWMNTLPEKVLKNQYIVDTLNAMWDDMLVEGCYFLRRNLPEMVKTVDNNIAQSCMRLLNCFLHKYIETEIKKVTAEQIDQLGSQIKAIFMFCFTWSVGGTTDLVGRKRFDGYIREKMQKFNVTFPAEKQIYDWHLDSNTGEWNSWFDTIPAFDVDIRWAYSEIVVPTEDSIRMKYLMKKLIENDKHVLMPGPTGTGKTMYVQQLTTYGMSEEFLTINMCFSA